MQIAVNTFRAGPLQREEALFHTANGYLGVRGNFEEGYPAGAGTVRGCYINGFYDSVGIRRPEKTHGLPEATRRMVNLPDMQTTRLYFGNEEFSLFNGKILDYSRTLDMDAGTVTRSVHWRSPGGKEVRISFERMVSFTRKELFLTVISVEGVNLDCELKIVSEANCAVFDCFDGDESVAASERKKHIHMQSVEISGDTAVALCNTAESGLSIAAAMGHSLNTGAHFNTALTPNGFKTACALKPGSKPVVIGKFCAYSDSLRHKDCKQRALAVLDKAMADGADAIFAEQKAYLADFWNAGGIAIHGDDKSAEGMAYNLYGLLQSAGCDGFGGIPARGLSGEGDGGHYSGDAELYMLPFFIYTHPEYAKNLLSYRYSILESAREHARALGHKKGALYPWRSLTGRDCSPCSLHNSARYHINGDVAHSFLQYYYATKDLDFMAEKGAEVLVETARLWVDAGWYDSGKRLCFNGVTGPDEYSGIANNNYFTNLSAKHNLIGAVSICKALKEAGRLDALASGLELTAKELKSFEKAAKDIYIPYDEKLDINPQDDSFLDKEIWDLSSAPKEDFPLSAHYHPLYIYRHQVCKQADTVLAHYLYEDADESTILSSYKYYEAITAPDSPLAACAFSIMASRTGMTEKAYNYFLKVVRADLDDAGGDTRNGIHAANMGGAYLAVAAGFAGLRLKHDSLRFRFTIPKAWSGYDFSLSYSGSLLHISVKTDDVKLTLVNGRPVLVFVDDISYVVRDTVSLKNAVH